MRQIWKAPCKCWRSAAPRWRLRHRSDCVLCWDGFACFNLCSVALVHKLCHTHTHTHTHTSTVKRCCVLTYSLSTPLLFHSHALDNWNRPHLFPLFKQMWTGGGLIDQTERQITCAEKRTRLKSARACDLNGPMVLGCFFSPIVGNS